MSLLPVLIGGGCILAGVLHDLALEHDKIVDGSQECLERRHRILRHDTRCFLALIFFQQQLACPCE